MGPRRLFMYQGMCVQIDVLEYSHMFQQLYCTKQDPVHISLVSHTFHIGRKGLYNCTTLTRGFPLLLIEFELARLQSRAMRCSSLMYVFSTHI